MKIANVILETTKLIKMKNFYTSILGLPLNLENADSFSVQAGFSRLTFVASERRPYYHLAFRTNEMHFDQFYSILENTSLLLPDEHGSTSLFWKGKQMYFHDPEGNVLEILARDIPIYARTNSLYDICEVGLPSSNIDELSDFLSEVKNEFISENESFRFFGDRHGVFVLVKEGRPWYPKDKPAQIDPVTIEIYAGKSEKALKHPSLPYSIEFLG
ncbi:MAG: VOC family protein [Bacillota bacterium]